MQKAAKMIRHAVAAILTSLSLTAAQTCFSQSSGISYLGPAFQPSDPAVGTNDAYVIYNYTFGCSPWWENQRNQGFELGSSQYTEEDITHVHKNNSTSSSSRSVTDQYEIVFWTCDPGGIDQLIWHEGCINGSCTNTGNTIGAIMTVPYWHDAEFGERGGDGDDIIYDTVVNVPNGHIEMGLSGYEHAVVHLPSSCNPSFIAVGEGVLYSASITLYPTSSPTVWPSWPASDHANFTHSASSSDAQITGASLNGSNNLVVVLGGPSNVSYTISASTNLTSWTTIGTLTFGGTSGTFTDTNAHLYDARFYRTTDGTNHPDATGFIKVTAVPGDTMIADQLIDPSGSNTLGVIMPSVPNGTTIYKYDARAQAFCSGNVYSNGWSNPEATLYPGEGAFIHNPTTTNIILKFVGTVPTGTLTVDIPANESLMSSILPKAASLDSLNYPAENVDAIYQWDTTTQGYIESIYFGGLWFDAVPTVKLGESFLVITQDSSTRTWTNTFNLWP